MSFFKVAVDQKELQEYLKTYYGEKTLNKEVKCFELSKSEIQTAQAFLLLFWIYIIPYFFYIIYLFIKD